jgi:hypothetical protein
MYHKVLKPWKKEIMPYYIRIILATPRNWHVHWLRGFYRDMRPSCAHILKPLTYQSGLKKKAPIKWTDDMQKDIQQNALAYGC